MPFKMEELGHRPKNARNAVLEAGKGEETDAPLEHLEGVRPC